MNIEALVAILALGEESAFFRWVEKRTRVRLTALRVILTFRFLLFHVNTFNILLVVAKEVAALRLHSDIVFMLCQVNNRLNQRIEFDLLQGLQVSLVLLLILLLTYNLLSFKRLLLCFLCCLYFRVLLEPLKYVSTFVLLGADRYLFGRLLLSNKRLETHEATTFTALRGLSLLQSVADVVASVIFVRPNVWTTSLNAYHFLLSILTINLLDLLLLIPLNTI